MKQRYYPLLPEPPSGSYFADVQEGYFKDPLRLGFNNLTKKKHSLSPIRHTLQTLPLQKLRSCDLDYGMLSFSCMSLLVMARHSFFRFTDKDTDTGT